MDFNALAKSRRSIRSFIQQDIPSEIVTQLLEAAQAAPSGGNRQPWHFYVIKNKSVIAEIVEKSCKQNFLLTAPVVIVVCTDIPQTESRYGERGRNLYSIQDTAAAIQNILLCAKSLELGTCWCGAFDESAMAEILNIPSTMRSVALIPIGYPATNPSPTSRRPIEEIATFID